MIARRLLADDWWKILAYTGVLTLNLVASILAFPTFQQNFGLIANLIPDFLPSIKDAIRGAGAGGIDGFLAINHLFKAGNIVGSAAAIILALGTIVREVEVGTIGLLLSRPISRARILIDFSIVHLIELTLPLFAVSCATPLLASWLIEEDVALVPLLLGTIHSALFVSLVYGLSLLCAILFTEQIKVAAVAGGICVLSFILYFVEATRPFTLYRLSSIELYAGLARGGGLATQTLLVCASGSIASLLVTYLVFRRRDY